MYTSKENISRLFDNAGAERAGVQDGIWARTLRKWVTQGYPAQTVNRKVKETAKENGRNVTREVEKAVEEPVPPVEHFGFDMMGVGGGYDLMPIRGVHEVVEETDEWHVIRNGAGALLKWWKDKDGTPEHVDFVMTSREIWDRDYRPHLLSVERSRVNVDATRQALQRPLAQEKWTFYGTLFIWEQMRRSLGDLCMYESLILHPDWIHDINRVYTDHLKAHFKILLEEAGVPDGMWLYEDLGFKQRLFCSPKVLEELIFPYYKEVVDLFHAYGVKVVLHTCGFTADALPLVAFPPNRIRDRHGGHRRRHGVLLAARDDQLAPENHHPAQWGTQGLPNGGALLRGPDTWGLHHRLCLEPRECHHGCGHVLAVGLVAVTPSGGV